MRKKLFVLLFSALIGMLLFIPAGAEDDCGDTETLDLPDGVYLEPFSSDIIDPVLRSELESEAIYTDDPLESSNDSGISFFDISDSSEDTDQNVELVGLTANQFITESDGTIFENIVNFEDKEDKNRSYIFNEIKNRFTFPHKGAYINLQGSCSDGEYVYYVFFVADKYEIPDGDDKDDKDDVIKDPVGLCILCGYFDEEDKFVTKKIRYTNEMVAPNCLSSADELKHGNDITYNEVRDELVILCCKDGYHNLAYSFDAAYFRDETDAIPDATRHELSCMISNIAYNRKHNKYVGGVLGDTNYFVFFDSEFHITGILNETNKLKNDVGRQAIYCDDNYLYVTYNISDTADTTTTKENVLCIFDWSGKLLKEINLDINRVYNNNNDLLGFYELEGITMLNDKVLLGFNCYFDTPNDDVKARVAHFYQYDLASEFFSVKYCMDNSTDNISTYINDPEIKTQNILHGLQTKTLKHTYKKNGYLLTGWNVYSVATGKWRYYNESTKSWGWYTAGSEPEGYVKAVYDDGVTVSQTVSAGNQVLFCAVWAETDKFYVSFDSNGGTGEKPVLDHVVHGTSTPLPKCTFKKDKIKFKGWNAYAEETGKWYYKHVTTGDKGWYTEGEQPDGYMKYVYSDGASIKQTVSKGSHVTFYAMWNEFVIYYDAGGRLISKNDIKTPSVIEYGVTKANDNDSNIELYNTNSIAGKDSVVHQAANSFDGYYQHRLEKGLWRYADENNSNPYWSANSADDLYVFTGDFVSQTGSIGEHIVFIAKWS